MKRYKNFEKMHLPGIDMKRYLFFLCVIICIPLTTSADRRDNLFNFWSKNLLTYHILTSTGKAVAVRHLDQRFPKFGKRFFLNNRIATELLHTNAALLVYAILLSPPSLQDFFIVELAITALTYAQELGIQTTAKIFPQKIREKLQASINRTPYFVLSESLQATMRIALRSLAASISASLLESTNFEFKLNFV